MNVRVRLTPRRNSRFAAKVGPLEWAGLAVVLAGVVLLAMGSGSDHRSLFGPGVALFVGGACIVAGCKLRSRWLAFRAATGWVASEIEQQQHDDKDRSHPDR